MTPPTKVKLTGGAFQDSEGEVLAYGYLEMALNQDENIAGVGQIASGITIKILLDGNGSVEGTSGLVLSAAAVASGGVSTYTGTISGGANNAFAGLTFVVTGFLTSANNGTFVCTASTATTLTLANAGGVAETHAGLATASQAIWGVDQMSPVNAYYRATGFTVLGQPAWGPNNQQVLGNGGTFDVGTWIPNEVFSWSPPLQTPELETNGTPNAVQTLLDLEGVGGTTLTDNGDGSVDIKSPDFFINGLSGGGTPLADLTFGVGFQGDGNFTTVTNPADGLVLISTDVKVPTGGTTGQVLTKVSGTNYDTDWETPAAPSASGLPDPFDAQYSLWTPNNQGSDNVFFTQSSIWGSRVVATSQATPFYTNIEAIGNWTTPVTITRSQSSPDQYMGYSEAIKVNHATTSKLQVGGGAWIYPGRSGKFKAVEMAATGVANFRHWIGIFDQFADISVLEPAAAAAVVAGAMFFFNSNDSANIQCFTSNRSGSFHLVDSGVPLSTTVISKLEIDWDGAGTYTFKINGTTVAAISTFTPTAALGSGMCMMYALGSNGNGTGQGTRIAMLYGENSY